MKKIMMSKKMILAALLLLSCITFFTFKNIKAQVHVKDPKYDVMLSTLLAHSVREISVKEANEMKNVAFIDAREKGEYVVSHIQGAIWCGYDDFNMSRLSGIGKETDIVVYCSVGYRSEKITEKLIAAGYGHVFNLYGGIFEWVNNGYPVVDASDQPTAKIHGYSPQWSVWLTAGEKVY